MRRRCNSPKDTGYKDYGGRGIKVCQRWNKFNNFLADMGERPKGYSLERIDVNGNYEPKNCKWIPMSEQGQNTRRVHNGRAKKAAKRARIAARRAAREAQLTIGNTLPT